MRQCHSACLLTYLLRHLLLTVGLFSSLSASADGVIVKAADRAILESVSAHKQNYVLPLTYKNGQGSAEQSELIFRFSVKMQAFIPELYFAYTQTSFWNFLDTDNSSPFRETNYNPEVFYHITPDKNPYGQWGAYAGFEHISNGRPLPLSRSLDRLYFRPYWDSNHGEYSLKLWVRRPEDRKDGPDDSQGDDNPDIYRYLGYGEFYFYRQKAKGRAFSGMLRGNPSTGKGAIQLDYSWPLKNSHGTTPKSSFLFARVFSGYGETLIDYSNYVTRFSVGLEFR